MSLPRMRITGPALNVSFLLISGSASMALLGCASTSSEAPQDAEVSTTSEGRRATIDPSTIERAGGTAAAQDDQAGADAELLTLREQKNRLLFDSAMARAAEMKQQLKLEEAMAQVDRALSINGQSLEAKQMRAELAALLDRPDGVNAIGDAEASRFELKLEQLKIGVRQDLSDAKMMLQRGDYGGAVAELRLAETKIEVGGYDIEWEGTDVEVRDLLARAESERSAASAASKAQSRREAFELLKQKEIAENDRQQAQVDLIVSQAALAFEEGRYSDAEESARLALQKQPKNDQAEEIRTAAFRAGRQQVQSDYLVKKEEQFKKYREEIESMRIARNEIITLPDADEWRRKSA
ncbi:MAG: hypothetical protein P8M11_14430, partial [Planctomycetota bacterium]|nr:hypothetical protein [Planctomycetota bacterium]